MSKKIIHKNILYSSKLFSGLNEKFGFGWKIHEDNSSEAELQVSSKYSFVDVAKPIQSNTQQFKQKNGLKNEPRRSDVEAERSPPKTDNRYGEAEVFGRSWSLQYQNLTEDQKIFAKKAIDDILFEARLGTLHRHSVKINDSLCQHCQATFINTEYAETIDDKIEIDEG